MNAKMGGALWAIPRPQEVPAGIMIIGIDVYHKTIQKGNSVMGFVASLNPEIS